MDLSRPLTRVVGVSIVVVTGMLLVSACGSTPEPAEPSQEESMDMQAMHTMAPMVAPQVSINALMVSSIDHAAHLIWDTPGMPPENDMDWLELEYHAIQLAAMGTMISIGGSGPADAGWAHSPIWQQYSQEMADVGAEALAAARSKNVEAISTAGDRLVEICENCHKEFKPDSPTEGLVHTPHYPR